MGTFGAIEGLRNPAVRGKSLKMKANAIMNGSGLRGGKAGNGLGAMSKTPAQAACPLRWVLLQRFSTVAGSHSSHGSVKRMDQRILLHPARWLECYSSQQVCTLTYEPSHGAEAMLDSGRKDVTSSWGARCWCRRTYGSWKRVSPCHQLNDFSFSCEGCHSHLITCYRRTFVTN